jgi:hypothetical protein
MVPNGGAQVLKLPTGRASYAAPIDVVLASLAINIGQGLVTEQIENLI